MSRIKNEEKQHVGTVEWDHVLKKLESFKSLKAIRKTLGKWKNGKIKPIPKQRRDITDDTTRNSIKQENSDALASYNSKRDIFKTTISNSNQCSMNETSPEIMETTSADVRKISTYYDRMNVRIPEIYFYSYSTISSLKHNLYKDFY